MIQIFKNTNIDFVGKRFIAYTVSAVMVILGIIGLINIARGTANLGIDFAGGSVVSLKFDKEMDVALIRSILDKNGITDASVQTLADAPGMPKTKVLIRIKKSSIKIGQVGEVLDKMFSADFPPAMQFNIEKSEQIKAESVFTVKFESVTEASKVKALLDKKGLKDSSVESKDGKIIVRLKRPGVKTDQSKIDLEAVLLKELPAKLAYVRDRTEDVGPAVSKKLQGQAIWAIVASLIGITIYIMIRFDANLSGGGLFGVSAAAATLHDILVLVGFVYVMNMEFTLLIMTAILTIAGYSLTDTVVVFDRIRDNLKLRLNDSFGTIVNASVNEVLARTFMTSVTTLLAALALFILGGEVIHDFSKVLI
ncbi:MAG: protein translocase subunit SecF, partial [Candidatus Firestonebacteria bacterium]